MAKMKLGGTEITVPEMNFVAVERSWDYVELAMKTMHPIAGTNAALAVIAASIMEGEDFDCASWGIDPHTDPQNEEDKENAVKLGPFKKDPSVIHVELLNAMRKKLKANEIGEVKLCMFEILADAGFEIGEPGSGEDHAEVEKASPSPETAPDTLQSSSPQDAKEEAGTA